jgi:hypothetical protein
VNPIEFKHRLSRGGTVPLSRKEWEELAPHFSVEERHRTQLAGDLLIVRVGEELVAVEAPSKDARVARVLGDVADAQAFVQKRMEEYERMWDGCGVRVDYYGGGEG